MTRPSGLPGRHALIDMVINPQDPGYRLAAQRAVPRPQRWYDRPAVALCCALIGFLLVVAYVSTHRAAPEVQKTRQALIARVHSAQDEDTALAETQARLTEQLQARQKAALGNSGALSGRLRLDQLLAGETAVTGPGLQVVLTEPKTASATPAPGRAGSVPQSATNILTDRDVRSVVNELWSDGAEAIAVNGVRLTPTSAIRFAGQAVLVDFEPITSPYRIAAIGPADELDTDFASSAVASRYQTMVSADGIGFSFDASGQLSLPANAVIAPRYATVLRHGGKAGGK